MSYVLLRKDHTRASRYWSTADQYQASNINTLQMLPFCFPTNGGRQFPQLTDTSDAIITSAFQEDEQHLENTKSLEPDELRDTFKRARVDFLCRFEETFPKPKDIGVFVNPDNMRFNDQLNQIRVPEDQLNQIRDSQDQLNQIRDVHGQLTQIRDPQDTLNQIRDVHGQLTQIRVPQGHLNQISDAKGQHQQNRVPQRCSATYVSSYNDPTNHRNHRSKGDRNPRNNEIWHLVESMCTTGNDGHLSSACGIVTTNDRDFVVADPGSARIKVYDQFGQLKSSINTNQGLHQKQQCHVREVAFGSDGRYFVTDKTQFVKVFDTTGMLVQTFATFPPSTQHDPDPLPPTTSAQLSGLTMDSNQRYVLVGEVKARYISKHRLDGSYLHSIKTSIAPWYLAMTLQENIVISSPIEQTVQVIDSAGRLLHSLTGPGDWMPTGVCCSVDDSIYVCNFASGCNGVYRFSVLGQYLGCVTRDVTDPTGVALTKYGDQQLLVAQWGRRGVKIFSRDLAASSLSQQKKAMSTFQ